MRRGLWCISAEFSQAQKNPPEVFSPGGFFVACQIAFASKLAPTWECISNVGASLLAKGSTRYQLRAWLQDAQASWSATNARTPHADHPTRLPRRG
ncbi:hypothetical protein DMX02_15805 [Pseudomonas jessenii]|nr:hypothetical protein DMX02_15805 [Pseudomonas jessenii]